MGNINSKQIIIPSEIMRLKLSFAIVVMHARHLARLPDRLAGQVNMLALGLSVVGNSRLGG